MHFFGLQKIYVTELAMMSPVESTFNLIIDGDKTQFRQCQFSSDQSIISLSESQFKRMRKSKNQKVPLNAKNHSYENH